MISEPVAPHSLPSSSEAGGRTTLPATPSTAFVVVMAVLTGTLGFLLASTVARNSDLWLHLAAGRLLAQGQSPLATAPFTSAAAGSVWINHSWLADLGLYLLYTLGGGKAIVIAKAILVAALALLFFCFRRHGTGAGVTALAACLALLALGPWLVLRPTLLSLVGVVLTLYLLEQPRASSRRWLLVPLFALWANLDGWFVLGPLLVGLYAIGAVLRPRVPGEARSLVLLTLAGLVACLLTPFHYHTFAWPTPLGLSHTEQVLMEGPLAQPLVFSPLGARFVASSTFVSAGAWAYYALLALGALSFVLCGRALQPGRLLAWVALAALSLYQARAIPFFAVAAVPVLVLNWQERARAGTSWAPSRGLLAIGRFAAVLLGLVLLVLAWPGWLQPAPHEPRTWAVEPDDSMPRLARLLDRWHKDGALRPDRFALTSSPEAAAYLAWFCPAEKGFVDSRWPLFNRVADDFVHMQQCLLRNDGPGPDLGPLLDAHRIDRIIVYDPDLGRTSRAYRSLLLDSQWQLLALEGGAALFGRRPPPGQGPPWKPHDPIEQAYAPVGDHRAPPAPRAPLPPTWFDPFVRAVADSAPDRAEAALHLLAFDLLGERMQADLGKEWLASQAVGLVGSATGCDPAGTAGALAVRITLGALTQPRSPIADQWAARFFSLRDRGPSERLLLAVRAARRALAYNPDDPGAFLLLGEAYFRMARFTREQSWYDLLPLLGTVRRCQALTALEQAIALRSGLDQAHAVLGQLYLEEGLHDAALDHVRARVRIAQEEVRKGGPAAGPAADRLPVLVSSVEGLEALVRQGLDAYEANAIDPADPSKVLPRAQLAARHGLARKALDMLLASHPAVFGKEGTRMQLELMLRLGQAHEVRDSLGEQHVATLGYSAYHWFRAQAAAACGDYAGADEEIDLITEEFRYVGVSVDRVLPVRPAIAVRAADAVLVHPARGAGPAGLAGALYLQYEALHPLGGAVALLRKEADLRVLRGMLALEAGAVENANQHFRAAVQVWAGPAGRPSAGAGVDFAARPIAEQALRWLAPFPRGRGKNEG
jgi:tetratricopeptide (TPR) repeat protein